MRTAGYEIHLGMTLGSLEAREIAFLHDYAFRRSAEGLYFHLDWSGEEPPGAGETAGAGEAGRNGHESAALLETIAAIKQSSPRGMFFSPQCVRYARRESGCDACAADGVAGLVTRTEWCASCVGGKTFAYIGPAGTVQVCKEIPVGSGSLRSNGYDFKALWEETTLFADLRTRSLGCAETRGRITDAHAAAAGECAA
jgi:hypothetical protein